MWCVLARLGAHGTLFTRRIMPYCRVWLAGSTSIHILITRYFEQLSVISVKGDSYESFEIDLSEEHNTESIMIIGQVVWLGRRI